MLQVTVDALGTKRIVIPDDGVKRTCGIERGTPRRATRLLISAAFLAATSLSQTQADSLAGPRGAVHLAQATTSDAGEARVVPEHGKAEALARELAAAL